MANSRPFMDFIREQRNGVLHDELSDALQEAVAAVMNEGGTATLTLKITVKSADAGEGALMVKDDIITKLPKQKASGSIFFASPENNLIREDPKQHKLPLQEIKRQSDPRDIASA
ncbi:MAG: hypothetical protein KGH91_07385 [Rhodospirillales bacterium]|nr:hypothetical protein [Rhodospirillales bacterium]